MKKKEGRSEESKEGREKKEEKENLATQTPVASRFTVIPLSFSNLIA